MAVYEIVVMSSRYHHLRVDAPTPEAALEAISHPDVGADLYDSGEDEGWEYISQEEYTGPKPPAVVVNQDGSPVTFPKSRAGLTERITLVKEGE